MYIDTIGSLSFGKKIILIGEKDEYEALSREIFYEKMNSKKKKT